MTALTDIKAITLTSNAKALGQAAGTNLASLMVQAQQHASELEVLLKQIIAIHPTTGGADATNLTALNAILAELA